MKTELSNLVKFRTEIGCFKLQNNQNVNRRFKSLALKRRISLNHVERSII